jgi:hypothetical protein
VLGWSSGAATGRAGSEDRVTEKAKRRIRLFIVTVVTVFVISIVNALELTPVSRAVASTLGAAVPGGVALLDELRAERAVSEQERANELVGGTVSSDPWRLLALVALGMVAIERAVMIVFALVYWVYLLVIGAGRLVTFDHVVETASLYAFPVTLPVLALSALLFARYVAHRVPTTPIVWVAGALLGAVAIDIALLTATLRVIHMSIDMGLVAKLYVLVLVPELAAAVIGVRWAERDRGAYLMARLFTRLRTQDQAALVELAKSVAEPTPPMPR